MTVLRTYDTMRATARGQPEGSLVYVIDQTDLYLRVRDGVRQVQLGSYIPLPPEDGNEVAAVVPPPVVPYSPDLYNNPSEPVAPPHTDPRLYPTAHHPSQPDPHYPAPSDPRFPSYSDRINQPDGRYTVQTSQDRGYYPNSYFPVTPHRPPYRPPAQDQHQHTAGPGLHLIALNSPQSGAMRGIHRADFLCFSQAQAIGMRGTFRAFLSAKLQDLHSIVRKADRTNLPILNLKDEVVFDSWEDIFQNGRMKDNVPIYSFDGKNILTDNTWPQKLVWHGSLSSGQRHMDSYCETWRVGEQTLTGMASDLQSGQLLQQTTSSCSSLHIVLCIENSYHSSS